MGLFPLSGDEMFLVVDNREVIGAYFSLGPEGGTLYTCSNYSYLYVFTPFPQSLDLPSKSSPSLFEWWKLCILCGAVYGSVCYAKGNACCARGSVCCASCTLFLCSGCAHLLIGWVF